MNAQNPQFVYKAFNPDTRRYEEVDPLLGEFFPGDRIVRMSWCNSAETYVTIPGSSVFVLNSNHEWVLDKD